MAEEHIQITEQDIQECLTILQNLIRINTTNPPGKETEACKYLANLFKKEGIPFTILESGPSRGNIISRLKGDGSKQPLLLSSHLDVVPCEKQHWSEDPFSGVIKDDCVWGRGAVDMKNMTAMELAVFLKAKRNHIPLKRDLILAAVADEETGGKHGAWWLVKHHASLIQAEYALNEVGGFSLPIDDKIFYPIGVAEKGICWLRIIARGDPGHGSMPHDNQALPKLGLAAHKLATTRLPFHDSVPANGFIKGLAQHQSLPKKIILNAMTKKGLSHRILNRIFKDKTKKFLSLFHNTATPTIIRAGTKQNVIPSQGELFIDGRILPDQSADDFVREVKAVIGDDFNIEISECHTANVVDHGNKFFNTLSDTLKTHDPEAIPIPFLNPAFTDAKAYAALDIKCYGFAPLKLPKDLDFSSLFHGHNERLPLDSLKFGVNVLWDVIEKTCL